MCTNSLKPKDDDARDMSLATDTTTSNSHKDPTEKGLERVAFKQKKRETRNQKRGLASSCWRDSSAKMSCFQRWKPVVAMVAVDFALAVVNVLFKLVLDQGMKHLVIVTYRQSISTVFLTPIAYLCERTSRPYLTAPVLCLLCFSALIGGTLTQYLFLLGLEYTSATFTCAFITMVPVNTFIMALPLGLEKLNTTSKSGRAKLLGTLVCVGGALLLTLYKGMPLTNLQQPAQEAITIHKIKHRDGTKNWAFGSIVLTAGSILWSSWFLIQARIGKKYPFQYSSTAIMSFFSALQSAILSLIIDRNISGWVLKGKLEIASVIYAGTVGSGLCYVVMSWCVKQKGPVFTSAFCPFVQIFVAVFDIFVLHTQIHLGSVLGSILVIAGMYILLWGKSKEAQTCAIRHTHKAEEDGNGDSNQVLEALPISTNHNTA